MKYVWLAILVLVGVGTLFAADVDGKSKDQLQGVWVATEIIDGGKKVPDMDARLEFVGEKVKLTMGGKGGATEQHPGTYTIDTRKFPATMDITFERNGEKVTLPAIYELKGDTLKLCHPQDQDGREIRPSALEPTVTTVLVTLKRQKSEK